MRTDPDFVALETERLVLRRSLPEDAEAIAAYRSDPAVHATQGWSRTDADHVRAEIQEMLTRLPGADGWVQFSVVERDGGRLVGDVGLCPADDEPGVMKLGYTVAPAAQGRGYATEATRALADYAIGMLGAEVLRAYADADNVASRRVMEKVGMRLLETFQGEDEDGAWTGVRYERAVHAADTTP
jgi:RimJ/RimL family protein N-acetyltransferase